MDKTNNGLKRAIGPVSLAANVVNLAIGAGIFVLPAKVFESIGNAGILAYIVCGTLIFMVMLCFAEVGSFVTRSGGVYAYVESAFGPFFGFLTSNVYWFGFGLVSDAAIINALADMLGSITPQFSSQSYRITFFALSFGFLAYINVLGVKHGSRLVEFITFAKLMPLGLLLFVGWTTVSYENLVWTHWPSWDALGEASLILFFAFGGAEASLTVSGEIKNPARTVPLGILWGIAVVVFVYMAIHLIAQGVLGESMLIYKDSPIVKTATEIFGPAGTVLILTCSAISIFGAISGDVLTMPRFLFAASQDKLLPKFLSKVHPRFATPYWAIVVYSSLGLIISATGGFKTLAILSSAAILITYLAVVMSAIKLRIDEKTIPGKGFMIRGGLTIHIIAMSTIIWFLSHLSSRELIAIVISLLVISILYLFARYFKRRNNSTNNSRIDFGEKIG